MPYNCYDCELHNYHECDVTKESIEDDYCYNGDSREKHCPLVEAIPKADYEARLKADMVAMLTEISLEIEELEKPRCHSASHADGCVSKWKVEGVIQQKINKLKEN